MKKNYYDRRSFTAYATNVWQLNTEISPGGGEWGKPRKKLIRNVIQMSYRCNAVYWFDDLIHAILSVPQS